MIAVIFLDVGNSLHICILSDAIPAYCSVVQYSPDNTDLINLMYRLLSMVPNLFKQRQGICQLQGQKGCGDLCAIQYLCSVELLLRLIQLIFYSSE